MLKHNLWPSHKRTLIQQPVEIRADKNVCGT
jgi:hypothetical protein